MSLIAEKEDREDKEIMLEYIPDNNTFRDIHPGNTFRDIHPEFVNDIIIINPITKKKYRRVPDIFDCWLSCWWCVWCVVLVMLLFVFGGWCVV